MAQGIKCLLCRHEALHSYLQLGIKVFMPMTSALGHGDRRMPAASLAQLERSRLVMSVSENSEIESDEGRWLMLNSSLHTHTYTETHSSTRAHTYTIIGHTSHTQMESADPEKESDYMTMAKPLWM